MTGRPFGLALLIVGTLRVVEWWRVATEGGRELDDASLAAALVGPDVPWDDPAHPLAFRNINVDPAGPVEFWGFEGLISAVERGGPAAWHRVLACVRAHPGGAVETQLRQALAIALQPDATSPASARVVARALDLLTDH